MPKQIPDFENEDAERAFWDSQDSADYIDWSQAQSVLLPKLKPSTKTISLRLPESMLAQIRLLANKQDVPYQSLIKIFLQERIDEELHRS
jgi:predicted DNA binding CopG/RHH family protein